MCSDMQTTYATIIHDDDNNADDTTDHMPRRQLACRRGLYVTLQVTDSPEYPQNLCTHKPVLTIISVSRIFVRFLTYNEN